MPWRRDLRFQTNLDVLAPTLRGAFGNRKYPPFTWEIFSGIFTHSSLKLLTSLLLKSIPVVNATSGPLDFKTNHMSHLSFVPPIITSLLEPLTYIGPRFRLTLTGGRFKLEEDPAIWKDSILNASKLDIKYFCSFLSSFVYHSTSRQDLIWNSG